MNEAAMTFVELVSAVRSRNPKAEQELFTRCKKYFNANVSILPHFDNSVSDDIFQESYLLIWTEIQNAKIFVKDGVLCRRKDDGKAAKMTCSLTSFMMAIARNKQFKHLRLEGPALFVNIEGKNFLGDELDNDEVQEKERKLQLVDEAIVNMSSSCKEILTLYYVKGFSLEKILEIRPENTSKDGLKTRKSKCLSILKSNLKTKMSYDR